MPDLWVQDAYSIDYETMYARGFRGIIFDIDNTLVLPDAPADARAKELFQRLREAGFRTVILSNNTGERAGRFAEEVGSDVVTGALKPFPGKYKEAMDVMGLTAREVFFVGDQIYTDIWGANNADLYSVLTHPFTDREEIQIVLKRVLEKPVLARLRRREQK